MVSGLYQFIRRKSVKGENTRFRIFIIGLLRTVSIYFITWGVVALIAALGLLAYVSIPVWFATVCYIYGAICITLGFFSWKRAADYRSIPVALISASARTILFCSSSVFLYRSRIAIDEMIAAPDAEGLLGTAFVYTGISMGVLAGALLLALIDNKKTGDRHGTGKKKSKTRSISRPVKNKKPKINSAVKIEKTSESKTKLLEQDADGEKAKIPGSVRSENEFEIDPRKYRTDRSVVKSYLIWSILLAAITLITGLFAFAGDELESLPETLADQDTGEEKNTVKEMQQSVDNSIGRFAC